jgi:signal transduction histidine kinase
MRRPLALFTHLILCLCWVFAGYPVKISAQQPDQSYLGADPMMLIDDVLDQEGMFFLPGPWMEPKGPSSVILEKQYQAAIQNNEWNTAAKNSIQRTWIKISSGDFQNALKIVRDAGDAWKRAGDERGVAYSQLLESFITYKLLSYEDAIRIIQNARRVFEKENLIRAEVASAILEGQSYLAGKNFEKAGKKFSEAEAGLRKLNEQELLARILVQQAELFIRDHRVREGREQLIEASEIFRELNNLPGQALVQRDMGIIHFKQGEYDKAVLAFNESISKSPRLSAAKLLKDTYLKLFMLNSLSGNHELSNEYNIRYVQLRDSIDGVERSLILNSQLTRRELMEREAILQMLRKEGEISLDNLSTAELEKNRQLLEEEIDRLEKEKIIEDLNIAKRLSDKTNIEREERIRQLTEQKIQQDLLLSQKELEVNKGNSQRNYLVMAFCFLVVIGLLVYNRYRNQRKSHDELDRAYRELSKTHHMLLAAQEQLVHSQKMASLGQLTAGIAHEIQNPLNFVNNFAELSVELIDELKQEGVTQSQLINDLKANLEKIQVHGKRADKIVKGMLVHSRTGQVDKSPADLNKMIDELLELSYHGNRSRDMTFVAEIIKNFDPELPEVDMVMQDISRVLVNLFNNAFYAVAERARAGEPGYKARVGVSTRQEGNQVIIKVRDNGTGISAEVRDRIFDPFFTTKPAGEGTGLGLSLSYDIITKGHGGTLQVNSEKNNFTEFIITLPID